MKDPAFLFYPSDFYIGVSFMTNEQVGKYIRLLCLQHQKGHLVKKDMLNICEAYDEDIFSKFIIDDEGKYFNERLDAEITKRKKYCEGRRNNRISAKCEGKSVDKICKTYVQHMENEIINEIINEDVNEIINEDVNGIEERNKEFINSLQCYLEKYPKDFLNKFYLYWSEQIVKGRDKGKMRFEAEKSWELSKRLATWNINNKRYASKRNGRDIFTTLQRIDAAAGMLESIKGN
jgi:hypothetical protein